MKMTTESSGGVLRPNLPEADIKELVRLVLAITLNCDSVPPHLDSAMILSNLSGSSKKEEQQL